MDTEKERREESHKLFKNIIDISKLMIDKNIYKFLFKLLYAIFFQIDTKIEWYQELNEYIEKVNKIIIKENEPKISAKYNKDNLLNILELVKKQNKIFAGDILENILIAVFSFAFKTKKENTFGKFLYNDFEIYKKNSDDLKISEWFIKNKFNNEFTYEQLLNKNDFNFPLCFILAKIHEEKKKYETKIRDQILKTLFNIKNFKGKIESFFEKSGYLEKDDDSKEIVPIAPSMLSNFNYQNIKIGEKDIYLDIGQEKVVDLIYFKSLSVSVYIYYQNKNSPLMKYIKNDKTDLEKIPFVFNLGEASIMQKLSSILLSPLRIEPRIEEIEFAKNRLKGMGFFELAKLFIFNKNGIKKMNFEFNAIKSNYLYFLNNALNNFDNYSVEILNLYNNKLRNDSGENLANILSHFKNLKRINLSCNELKNGVSSFLIMLKKLYRKGKTHLEALNLNNCLLNDISFYELGELLKSKYCKLKYLYLNSNNIPSNVNFLKKIKKNNSLIEIYLGQTNLNDNDTNDLMRIISNTKIENLSLYNNNISDFSQYLRIIYRTKLIKNLDNKKYDIFLGEPYLFNLDLSNNHCFNKNEDKIDLFKDIIRKTTLYCLDCSSVLLEENFNNLKDDKNNNSNEYDNMCKHLKNKVKYIQEKFVCSEKELKNNIIEMRKLQKKVDHNLIKEKGKKIIDEKLKDSKFSKSNLFINKMIETLMDKEFINVEEENIKENYEEIHEKLLNYILLKRSQFFDKNINQQKKIII